jgi:hypothetical protein
MNFIIMVIEATIYSLIEIEIEGCNGWAQELPTPIVLKIGTKKLTLYHVYMNIFIFLTISSQFQMMLTFQSFLKTFAYFLQFLLLEDVLWFVFNPFYTMRRYSKPEIWWHSQQPWILGIPFDNYCISFYCISISCLQSDFQIFMYLIFCYFYIFLCIQVAPFYHTFYRKLHN